MSARILATAAVALASIAAAVWLAVSRYPHHHRASNAPHPRPTHSAHHHRAPTVQPVTPVTPAPQPRPSSTKSRERHRHHATPNPSASSTPPSPSPTCIANVLCPLPLPTAVPLLGQ